MTAVPLPANEVDRLNQLRDLYLLDTPPDSVLDDLVVSAADATKSPVALITLIDSDRQWLKAKVGTDAIQTPRDIAFCAYTILGDDLFEVADTRLDARFVDNPLVVDGPLIRSYAGVPIVSGGHRLGALCVINTQPRRLDLVERQDLRRLADAVSGWLCSQYQCRRTWEPSSFDGMRSWDRACPIGSADGGTRLSLRRH